MIKIILKTYKHLANLKYDIKIVPVSISYERIYDINFFASEIISGAYSPGSSMINIFQKLVAANWGKLGKIFIKHCEPIDLTTYIKNFQMN